MSTVRSIANAPDKDAEYVLRRIALIEECDAAIKDRSREQSAARVEAGLRLIEVRARFLPAGQKGVPPGAHLPGWYQWLNGYGIKRKTAADLMRDAGYTEEERTAHKQKDAARKKQQRKKAKATASAPPLIYQDPCDDCNGEEERWQRSFSVLAGDAIAMAAFWTHEFGKEWEQYEVTSAMITLAEQAAASWQQMLTVLKARRAKQ